MSKPSLLACPNFARMHLAHVQSLVYVFERGQGKVLACLCCPAVQQLVASVQSLPSGLSHALWVLMFLVPSARLALDVAASPAYMCRQAIHTFLSS